MKDAEGQRELFPTAGIQPREINQQIDITVSRHRGAETSREAFQATTPKARQRQADQVLEYIKSCGAAGATCEEASMFLDIAYTAASARLTQLQAIEAVWFGQEKRPTTRGRNARVYFAK
jgi:hypothetical protein